MAPLVFLVVCAATLTQVSSKTFLALEPEPEAQESPNLLQELQRLLGSEHREDVELRAKRLEEVMRPTYLSLPKDASGGVGPEAVRYLLHRIFVDRHGWFVRGLAMTGDSWNSSSALDALKEHVHDEHSSIFDAHMGSSSSLHHTAVLAATLESLVHAETESRLHSSFRVAGVATDEDVTLAELMSAVDTYMLFYVAGVVNHTKANSKIVKRIFSKISEAYPMWDETKAWARTTVEEAIVNKEHVSFESSMQAIEVVGDRYGRWQNQECTDLKASLMELEENSTGRIPLDVFYKGALDGKWQFSESVAYLRQLGALDDSVPERPSVIIANYINGPSNCVAASKFYSVCCIDECEGLLGHLENRVAAPDASPEFLLELVANLPSATVSAPRQLSPLLVQRLQEIADSAGGAVPLHGRLFAQWLHHAYPRECPYPHVSGTTKPMTAREWKSETGEVSTMTSEMMVQQIETIEACIADSNVSTETQVPWTADEELFISRPSAPETSQKRRGRSGSSSVLRNMALFGAVFSMAVALVRGMLSASDVVKPCGAKSAKYMV